jgi:hypothetical protein
LAIDLLFVSFQFHDKGTNIDLPASYQCVSEPGLCMSHDDTSKIGQLNIISGLENFSIAPENTFRARTMVVLDLKQLFLKRDVKARK